jgi:hypothetical protein
MNPAVSRTNTSFSKTHHDQQQQQEMVVAAASTTRAPRTCFATLAVVAMMHMILQCCSSLAIMVLPLVVFCFVLELDWKTQCHARIFII